MPSWDAPAVAADAEAADGGGAPCTMATDAGSTCIGCIILRRPIG
jgi:hypothetical protein